MRRLRALLLLPILLLSIAAANPVLVPDVSQRKIDIVYSFTGAELLMFGAILYPGGRVPTEKADIVVVLRGPTQPLIVREKQKLGGLIWVNAQSARFLSTPSYYAIASSRPLDELVDERTAAIYELGVKNLQLSPASSEQPETRRRFENGLIDLFSKSKLYDEQQGSVEISNGVLYRARLAIPARVPVGNYVTETFLIKDGRILAVASKEVQIDKSGFERFVAESARQYPLLYGLVAVLLSLLLGWGAAMAFRRI
ncbi:MAG: TIGR02186 family protein [Chakrabartia sp.]